MKFVICLCLVAVIVNAKPADDEKMHKKVEVALEKAFEMGVVAGRKNPKTRDVSMQEARELDEIARSMDAEPEDIERDIESQEYSRDLDNLLESLRDIDEDTEEESKRDDTGDLDDQDIAQALGKSQRDTPEQDIDENALKRAFLQDIVKRLAREEEQDMD